MNRFIVNIRGTNGAGKTKLAEAFMGDRREGGALGGEDVTLLTYMKQLKSEQRSKPILGRWNAMDRTMLVGKYGHANCGGCDTIPTQDLICDAVRAATEYKDCRVVVFEGSLVSTIFDRYKQLDMELNKKGWKYLWCYMSPSAEECIERVLKRTEGAKTTTIADKHRAVRATRDKAMKSGLRVLDMSTGWDAANGIPDAFYTLAGECQL